MIEVTIDGVVVSVEENATILDAAAKAGIRIPTLCYLENQSIKANCRICLVEVKGSRLPQPACATRVSPGMEVVTNSPAIMEARRENLRLILSHHPIDCQSCVRLGNSQQKDLSNEMCEMCFYCDCVRDGDCELQRLADEYDVNGLVYRWEEKDRTWDVSTASIVKDPGKCILCRRCVSACGEVQGIHVWSIAQRGCRAEVTPVGGGLLADSPCVECGECVRSCPVGALFERQDLDSLPEMGHDKNRTVLARIDRHFLEPYLRLAGLDSAQYTTEHLSAGLCRVGVDKVVGNADADQMVNEALLQELDRHLSGEGKLPLISATCPASVRYLESRYASLKGYMSTVPSAQEYFGRWAHEQYGKRAYAVSLTSCSAKKREAAGSDSVDLVMSPRETDRLFRRSGAELSRLKPMPVDHQETAGASAQEPGIQVREVVRNGKTIRIALACGLRAVNEVLAQVKDGTSPYAYIQLAACPGGCNSAGPLPFETM